MRLVSPTKRYDQGSTNRIGSIKRFSEGKGFSNNGRFPCACATLNRISSPFLCAYFALDGGRVIVCWAMLVDTGFADIQISQPHDTFGEARGEKKARLFDVYGHTHSWHANPDSMWSHLFSLIGE